VKAGALINVRKAKRSSLIMPDNGPGSFVAERFDRVHDCEQETAIQKACHPC